MYGKSECLVSYKNRATQVWWLYLCPYTTNVRTPWGFSPNSSWFYVSPKFLIKSQLNLSYSCKINTNPSPSPNIKPEIMRGRESWFSPNSRKTKRRDGIPTLGCWNCALNWRKFLWDLERKWKREERSWKWNEDEGGQPTKGNRKLCKGQGWNLCKNLLKK